MYLPEANLITKMNCTSMVALTGKIPEAGKPLVQSYPGLQSECPDSLDYTIFFLSLYFLSHFTCLKICSLASTNRLLLLGCPEF